jgi:hypothetical protein
MSTRDGVSPAHSAEGGSAPLECTTCFPAGKTPQTTGPTLENPSPNLTGCGMNCPGPFSAPIDGDTQEQSEARTPDVELVEAPS